MRGLNPAGRIGAVSGNECAEVTALFTSTLILIFSTGLLFFYFEMVCRKILAREFSQEFFHFIVSANRLEFASIRKALEDFDAPLEYSRFRLMLRCDFLALTYLLKNAGNERRQYAREEKFLILYFRLTLFSLVVRHLLRIGEKSAVLRLTAILQYFANVVGQRVSDLRFGNETVS